jgi:hypothetical protein
MIDRIVRGPKEYLRLAEEEIQFQEHFCNWIDGVFKGHGVSKSKAELIKLSLKTLKEKLNSRHTFLLLFSSMVTLIFATLDAMLSQKVGISTLVFSSFVGFLVLSERFNSYKYISVSEELSSVVEYWLKTAS